MERAGTAQQICLLSFAEITPEKPEVIVGAGFDATWMHSSYYDMRAFMKERRSLRKLQSLLELHPGYTSPTQMRR